MRKYLNTLYITTEDSYLSLKGETVNVEFADGQSKTIPLHTLESIVCFSYKGASPALMGKCAENNIQLSFFSPNGKYLANAVNYYNGNIFLRRKQFHTVDDEIERLKISKAFLIGKLHNSKYVLLRYARDHELQVDCEALHSAARGITQCIDSIISSYSIDSIRGFEGKAATYYYEVFDYLILNNKDCFSFYGRSKRPPTDNVNAMLSFAYTLLSCDCASALISVGLDPYCGFIHTDRSGRRSLSLDLVEELRSVYADRFVLTLINNRQFNGGDFIKQENGAVLFTDNGKRKFLSEWQKHKKDEITHPFLKEKCPWGLVPYLQALLLSRYIRGDLDGYPTFLWK